MNSPALSKNACQLCNEIIFREGASQLFENMDKKEGVQSGLRADLQAIETPHAPDEFLVSVRAPRRSSGD